MHEDALFRDLRRALDRLSPPQGQGRLLRATVWLGALSHVSEARLRSAWPALLSRGPAEGAALEVVVSSDLDDPRAAEVILTEIQLVEGTGP